MTGSGLMRQVNQEHGIVDAERAHEQMRRVAVRYVRTDDAAERVRIFLRAQTLASELGDHKGWMRRFWEIVNAAE